MTPFLLYIARGGLYLGLFYAFYLLVMRRTTFFRLNRVLLLLGSYLCLLIPFIRIRTSITIAIDPVWVFGWVSPDNELAEQAVNSSFPWKGILLAIYIFGGIATLMFYLVSACKMGRLIRKGEHIKRDGFRLVLLGEVIPSFSWGRTVVISLKDLKENPSILTHEQMHVRCRHSLDLIFFMPIQMLFWWNPLVWVTREELRLLHEYEADEGVIKQGVDASQYQLLLVRKAVGEHRFSLASGFQHAKLKNRISMMLKPASSGWIRWSYLALIPVLVAFIFACNPARNSDDPTPDPEQELSDVQETRSSESSEQDAVPFQLVEMKPTFNGGDAYEFSKWVNSQLHYPEQAKRDGAQGRVTLQFTIGTDGEMRDVKVLRGVREDLDAEALRVILSSPKWEPGIRDGKAVPVTYTFPIVYQLR